MPDFKLVVLKTTLFETSWVDSATVCPITLLTLMWATFDDAFNSIGKLISFPATTGFGYNWPNVKLFTSLIPTEVMLTFWQEVYDLEPAVAVKQTL